MRRITKKSKSQAISEYFLALMLIAALTIIGTATILPKIKTAEWKDGVRSQDLKLVIIS
ncbi:hypothetical protein KA005_17055 [bacterium]|nr:hypothetical protein [bacterium]